MAFHLIRYAGEGELKKLEKWIDHGVHINASNVRNETALFISSMNGHFKCVEFLLSRGADPNRLVQFDSFVIVSLFVCLSVCLFICLFDSLFVCLFVNFFAWLFIRLLVYLSVSVGLSGLVCPSVFLSNLIFFISVRRYQV